MYSFRRPVYIYLSLVIINRISLKLTVIKNARRLRIVVLFLTLLVLESKYILNYIYLTWVSMLLDWHIDYVTDLLNNSYYKQTYATCYHRVTHNYVCHHCLLQLFRKNAHAVSCFSLFYEYFTSHRYGQTFLCTAL